MHIPVVGSKEILVFFSVDIDHTRANSMAVLRTYASAEDRAEVATFRPREAHSADFHGSNTTGLLYSSQNYARQRVVLSHLPVESYLPRTVRCAVDAHVAGRMKASDNPSDYFYYDLGLTTMIDCLGTPGKLSARISGPGEGENSGTFEFMLDVSITKGLSIPAIKPSKERCTRDDLVKRIREFMVIIKQVHGKGKVTILFQDSKGQINESWVLKPA